MIIFGKGGLNKDKRDPNTALNQAAYIPRRVETWQSSRGRIMSNQEIDTLTVQIRNVFKRQGVEDDEGLDTDEDKYITESGKSESENP